MTELVITAANSITAVGHDGRMTAASVRAGVCRMFCYDRFMDASDNPITVAGIKGIEDDNKDTAARLGIIAERCLAQMLDEYFREPRRRPAHVTLLLGVACEGRPRPRYEERSIPMLLRAMQRWTNKADLQAVPHGNASMPHAIAEAARLIDTSPGTLCIIGGIDSLIRDSTLSWFESDRRLKSRSYGRQHGLIAGEAVSFLFVEGQARAAQQEKPVLARVTGVGVAEEPAPRISGKPTRNIGLSEACRSALTGAEGGKPIRAVLADLNGENARAKEWSVAEMRCFQKQLSDQRKVWKPAECCGDIGAASGSVLVNIATQGFVRGWLPSPLLVSCSDDHGACGAVVLEAGSLEGEKPAVVS